MEIHNISLKKCFEKCHQQNYGHFISASMCQVTRECLVGSLQWSLFCWRKNTWYRFSIDDPYPIHTMVNKPSGTVTIWDIIPKLIVNSNLMKSHLPFTFILIVKSFWNFAQSMVVILAYFVRNFKIMGQLSHKLWANIYVVSFEFAMSFGGCFMLEHAPGSLRACAYHYFVTSVAE